MTHLQRGICVVSGPWGVGKTTAVDLFAKQKQHECIVVKVERGSSRRGASPVAMLQQTLEAIRPYTGRGSRASLSNAYWTLRHMLHSYLNEWSARWNPEPIERSASATPRLTLVFDEAQYLSPDAIEMLRYWNDNDRTVTPFPLGLAFVGNSEFALEEDASGQSHISGAVRSRALFVETLLYEDLTNEDLRSVMESRGGYEPDAMALIIRQFAGRRVRRDLRSIIRLDEALRRQSPRAPISASLVRAELALERPVSSC